MRGHRRILPFAAVLAVALACLAASATPDSFHFVILGDRTGDAQPGVFEQVWRESAAEQPAFLVSVGDNIEGLDDSAADAQWREWQRIVTPYQRYPLYLAPGNHDVWSERSEQLYRKYAGHPLHYSFDYGPAHFTILDNSRSDEMPTDELAFLERDLQAHEAQPVKLVFSHRPSWLINAALGNRQFPLHQLAKRYGVRYVIAGHVHQMLHIEMDGVTYLSMPSSGGHLRNSKKYEDGWFFAYSLADVDGREVTLHIKELKPPHGQGRVTAPKDWGMLGLAVAAR
jgi:Icc protein